MEFEEFLITEFKIVTGNNKEPSFSGQMEEFLNFKYRLGEWAWEELIDNQRFEDYFEHCHFEDKRISFKDAEEFLNQEFIDAQLEIAVACLGKKEIEKRLEELK